MHQPVWVVGLAMACAPGLFAADLEAGQRALDRSDHAAALKELRPLAERGHAEAQFSLGQMYSCGRGVPKDETEAARWKTLSPVQLVREGRSLCAKAAERLEAWPGHRSDDLALRYRLLGHYFHNGPDEVGVPKTLEARRRHIFWLIEHRPASEVAGFPEATLDPAGHPLADARGHAEGARLWLAQAEQPSVVPVVFLNGARFFQLNDKPRADRLQPDNPAWADALGPHLAWQARLGPAFGGGPDTLKRALGYLEKSLARTTDVEWRMGRQRELARQAFQVGEDDRAQRHASERLALAQRHPGDEKCGAALHDGHVVLGRLALKRKQVAEARAHLLDAGRRRRGHAVVLRAQHGPGQGPARPGRAAGGDRVPAPVQELLDRPPAAGRRLDRRDRGRTPAEFRAESRPLAAPAGRAGHGSLPLCLPA